ncbi:MAG: bifunctional demethylmenaquinone methyltransferase/2-methoxy-6-polyprenyl-1,4-benzoquinol methylase UbiE [Chloroflexi bacterium]|nr:bifunctional demethylmenaquinone methyltransferase/2-methoxy-6-polyprenyl-1,4-benzoquinol methylase UbiE [Chloroflexota bacterium]
MKQRQLEGEAKATYVASMFARIARRYDLLNTVMTGGRHRAWKRLTVDIALANSTGPALDIATGTGDLALELARRRGVRPVVGLDIVPDMLAIAQAKARPRRRSRNMAWVQGDALCLPFPDDTFACAVCGFSLRNVTDIQQALTEMARVVRPGGRVVSLELTPLRKGRLSSRVVRFYFHRIVPVLGTILAGDHEAYTYLPNSVERFPSAHNLREMYDKAGLTAVGYRKVGLGVVAVHWGTKPT